MNFEKYKIIMNIQYNILRGTAFDSKVSLDGCDIYKSSVVADSFCNFVIINNEDIFDKKSALANIEQNFAEINRKPCIYIPRLINKHAEYKSYLINNCYKINDTDVCMTLVAPINNIETPKTINIIRVSNNEQYNDFMEVLESAYGGEISIDNPYAGSITDEYHEAIRLSLGNDKFKHFVLYKDNRPASVATLSYYDSYGIISNVGTKKEFQNHGLGKQIIKHCVDKFNDVDGKSIFLITELDSKNERWYQKLGFEPIFVNEQYIKNI